jgi:hypothetical protein
LTSEFSSRFFWQKTTSIAATLTLRRRRVDAGGQAGSREHVFAKDALDEATWK